MAGESFTKPAEETAPDLKVFDLDKYIAGSMRVTKYVDVYFRPGLQAEIDELDARLSASSDDEESAELAVEIEKLRGEMADSRVGFKFASVPEEQLEKLRKKWKGEDEEFGFQVLAAQCVQPPGLDSAGFRRMRDALGEGYLSQTIIACANAAQQGLGVTVPFSSASSRARRR